jgi:hypothetical protein
MLCIGVLSLLRLLRLLWLKGPLKRLLDLLWKHPTKVHGRGYR